MIVFLVLLYLITKFQPRNAVVAVVPLLRANNKMIAANKMHGPCSFAVTVSSIASHPHTIYLCKMSTGRVQVACVFMVEKRSEGSTYVYIITACDYHSSRGCVLQ